MSNITETLQKSVRSGNRNVQESTLHIIIPYKGKLYDMTKILSGKSKKELHNSEKEN